MENSESATNTKTYTLRALRYNCGLTLETASTLIGVSKDTLANYERGDTYPDAPIIKRIEDVYGVSFNEINFLLDDNGFNGKEEV